MRLIWFILGLAVASLGILVLMEPERVRQTVAGNNEIVFPANPDILRAGAISSRYPLVYERLEVLNTPAQLRAVASNQDVTLLIDSEGLLYRRDGGAFLSLPISPFRPPEVNGRDTMPSTRMIYDLALRRVQTGFEAFLSFAFEESETGCTSLGVTRTILTDAMLVTGGVPEWEWVFRSTPCIEKAGNQIALLGGGALLLEGDRLTVAVGTFSLKRDDFRETLAFLQSDETSYGKVIEVKLTDKSINQISKGHRDPVGLVREDPDQIWTAEHGPRGGDELNLLSEGRNYGWPVLTYGTAYGRFKWTGDPEPDAIQAYERPRFAWIPSVAPSSMLRSASDQFPAWRGDILISTLKGGQIIRVRARDGQVIFAEPIYVGGRIRDIAESDRGDLLLVLDRAPQVLRIVNAIDRVEAAPPEIGLCVACHQMQTDVSDPATAPSLVGILGRKVASLPDYPYSAALRQMNGTWTETRVINFVKSPQRFAHGTSHPEMDVANLWMRSMVEWLRENAS